MTTGPRSTKARAPSTQRMIERRAAAGDPDARFVLSVDRLRANGARQYGARFSAWLAAAGDPDPAATIAGLER